ncbi:MAG TPA: glycosyltransferase family 4 protein [Terriglobales bacterium]|nr:glycosyltransferase family 4 protein [Terriglobales bacterium]
MRIALIVPPFIPVPPKRYGGTELFAAHLAQGLAKLGFDVVIYTNGESTIDVEKRWLYPESLWPIDGEIHTNLRDINHGAWAVHDAAKSADIIHVSNAPSLVHSRFVDIPFVYTLHHPHEKGLSDFYSHYPDPWYVCISEFQRKLEELPRLRTIHHGIDPADYRFGRGERTHFTFLGRIAPVKGTHNAIEIAKRSGIPLKIAGEIQPRFKDYFESKIQPHIDGKLVEYVGEADLAMKNELLGSSLGLLFPIEWDEPFGLVMIEAMACGAPVYALSGGSVTEIVKDGVSGYIGKSIDELVIRTRNAPNFDFEGVRNYVMEKFSLDRMVQSYADLYTEILGEKTAEVAKDTLLLGEVDPRAIA